MQKLYGICADGTLALVGALRWGARWICRSLGEMNLIQSFHRLCPAYAYRVPCATNGILILRERESVSFSLPPGGCNDRIAHDNIRKHSTDGAFFVDDINMPLPLKFSFRFANYLTVKRLDFASLSG